MRTISENARKVKESPMLINTFLEVLFWSTKDTKVAQSSRREIQHDHCPSLIKSFDNPVKLCGRRGSSCTLCSQKFGATKAIKNAQVHEEAI